MFHIGLDVHLKSTAVCILNDQGKKVKEFVVRGDGQDLAEALAKTPAPRAICFEASTGCGALYDRLAPLAARVAVAHPGKLRLIFQTKKKCDRVDARKLATLLFLDQVPEAYIPAPDVRAWRSLIEFRHDQVEERTRIKNALRTLLRGCGAGPALARMARSRLWTGKGLALLAQVALPQPQDQLRRDLLLLALSQCQERIALIEAMLAPLSRAREEVGRLRTVPGVGARLAEAFAAYVDEAERFARVKQIGAYFGLTPSLDASGGRQKLGHITKAGPGTVRMLVIEAVWQALRRSPTLRAYFERIRQGKKERTKIALVATGHHLLRVMLAIWKNGSVWQESVTTTPPAPPPESWEFSKALAPQGVERRAVEKPKAGPEAKGGTSETSGTRGKAEARGAKKKGACGPLAPAPLEGRAGTRDARTIAEEKGTADGRQEQRPEKETPGHPPIPPVPPAPPAGGGRAGSNAAADPAGTVKGACVKKNP